MTRKGLAALGVCLVVGTTTAAGARDRAPSLADIRHSIESSSPTCRLDVDEELTLGRTKLWFVRRVVSITDDVDPEARAILEGLRRVEVGTYRIDTDAHDCPIPQGFEAGLAVGGWTRTARWTDGSGSGIVLQRMDADEEIDGLLVIEIGDRTVEIVRLDGRIHDVPAAAVQDDPGSTGALLGVN